MLRASCRARRFFFGLAGMQDKQKSPPAKAVGPARLPAKTGVFGSRLRSRRLRRYFRARRNFGTELAQTREKIAKFAAFAFLGLAVRALVLRARELSVNKDIVVLVERVCEKLAEAVERVGYVESDERAAPRGRMANARPRLPFHPTSCPRES